MSRIIREVKLSVPIEIPGGDLRAAKETRKLKITISRQRVAAKPKVVVNDSEFSVVVSYDEVQLPCPVKSPVTRA